VSEQKIGQLPEYWHGEYLKEDQISTEYRSEEDAWAGAGGSVTEG
jgi:hypothetical protein